MTLTIFSDGGSRGNPGPAASAFVIYNGETIVKYDSKYLGKTTNNVAEYNGVIFALQTVVEDKLEKNITFKMDSELVVKQLTGVYKIKDATLIKLSLRIKKIIKENNLNIKFVHVRRAENAFADKKVNEKLDDSSRL